MRLRRIAASLTLAASVWVIAPGSARADGQLLHLHGGGEEGLALVLGVVVVSPVLSLISTTVNAVSWADGTRPDWRWTVMGVGLGIVSVLVGGALLHGQDGDTVGPGLALVSWGALSTIVGIGAAAQPRLRLAERL